MAMFDDAYAQELSDNIHEALSKLVADFTKMRVAAFKGGRVDVSYYDPTTRAFSLLQALWKRQTGKGIGIAIEPGETETKIMRRIEGVFESIKTEILKINLGMRAQAADELLETKSNKAFKIILQEQDIDRVQSLINELRETVSKSTVFDDAHKRRLLKRLERMQSELHKRMSDLDVFWGGFVDAGAALGKFGKDAQPIFERMKDIRDILWTAQKKAEGLDGDSDTPQLPGS